MPVENTYLDCKSEQGRCGNLYHDRAKIGEDGSCTKARAWMRNSLPCVGCSILVPEKFGYRMNSKLIKLHAQKELESPRLVGRPARMIFFALMERQDGPVCGACAKILSQGLNPGVCPGKILSLDKVAIPFLLEAEVANALFREEREEAERERQFTGGRFARFFHAVRTGERIEFSGYKDEGSVRLTECTVHRNAPDLCLCGGWHNWSIMPAIVQDERKAFGFGPACAQRVRELFRHEDPFESGQTLDTAISSIRRASRPEPKVSAAHPPQLRLVPSGRDPHPDGYVTPSSAKRKPTGKSAAQRRRAEEQRLAAKAHKPGQQKGKKNEKNNKKSAAGK